MCDRGQIAGRSRSKKRSPRLTHVMNRPIPGNVCVETADPNPLENQMRLTQVADLIDAALPRFPMRQSTHKLLASRRAADQAARAPARSALWSSEPRSMSMPPSYVLRKRQCARSAADPSEQLSLIRIGASVVSSAQRFHLEEDSWQTISRLGSGRRSGTNC